jgi:hypothetical protein
MWPSLATPSNSTSLAFKMNLEIQIELDIFTASLARYVLSCASSEATIIPAPEST